MRKSPQCLSAVAGRLLRANAVGRDSADESPWDSLQRCCDTLRSPLVDLVGRDGFRALLARALALTDGEFPALEEVRVDAAGSLTTSDPTQAGSRLAEDEAGCIAVLAHFLGLLASFIGVELTRQLVGSAWPHIPVEFKDFSLEGEA